MKARVMVIAAAALSLAACEGGGNVTSSQVGGALAGGAAGGLLGSQIGGGSGQILATAGGTLLGAWIGSEIARSLTQSDERQHEQAVGQALAERNDGETISWNNPETGHSGEVQPQRTYQRDGRPCREFQQTIYVDGQTQSATGTACRQSDGTWELI